MEKIAKKLLQVERLEKLKISKGFDLKNKEKERLKKL